MVLKKCKVTIEKSVMHIKPFSFLFLVQVYFFRLFKSPYISVINNNNLALDMQKFENGIWQSGSIPRRKCICFYRNFPC